MAITTSHQWNGWNFFICFLISLGQLAFGYPAAIIGTTLAQPSFLIYMGLLDVTQDPPALAPQAEGLIGAMSGVFQAGCVVNVFIAAWVADKRGRKAAFLYLSLLSILGGSLCCGARNLAMFIVGRFFAGAGACGFLTVTPFYSAELAPPSLRGLMVGLNGINIAMGYALASYMGLAFYHVNIPAAQWRAPLGLALIWPLLMIIICFVVPESPRYLLMHGRNEEAQKVIFKLHTTKSDPDQEFARSEFYQMAKQAAIDREITPGWMEMFKSASNRRRIGLSVGFAFVGQSTGVLVLNNYGPTIYAALGYDTLKQLQLQAGWVTVGIVGNLVGAAMMDWVGRKPLMLLGAIGCCVCLILEAAMVSTYASAGTNKAGLQMGAAATYMFLFIYSTGIDVAGIVFYAEIFPNHLRARAMSLTIAVFGLTNLVYLQVAPTAFRNVGWKFYLVFIILSGLGAIWIWIYIPETKGIPLEEMAALFGDTVAVHEADIHLDHQANKLVVEEHGATDSDHICRVATEAGRPLPTKQQADPEKYAFDSAVTTERVELVERK